MNNIKENWIKILNFLKEHWVFLVIVLSIMILIILYIFSLDIFFKVIYYFKNEIPDDLFFQFPEIFLFLFMIFFIFKFIIFKIDHNWNQKISIFYIIAFLYIIANFYYILIYWEIDLYLMNNNVHIYKYANYIKLMTIVASILVYIFMFFEKESKSYLNSETSWIMLICILGMLLFTSSNDLFLMYLSLELQSLALYILCATKRYSNKSIEASLKYFIYGSYSSLILLLGLALIYFITGTLNFDDLHLFILPLDIQYEYEIIFNFAKFCILVGLLFKLAVFPYHGWLADIYEGTTSIITFFFAIVPKFSIFYMFYILYFNVFIENQLINIFIGFSCFFSIFLGTVWALYQSKFKKLLAYSAIVHMGYIIFPLVIDNDFGIVASTYYFIVYLLTTSSIFSVFLVLKKYNNTPLTNITEFTSIKKNNKLLNIFLSISLLSLAGIPPLAGFYGKLMVFNLLLSNGDYFIFFFLIALSIVSGIYYIRLIRFLFFSDKEEEFITFSKVIPEFLSIIIVITFIINVLFLFCQGSLLQFILQLTLIN